MKQTPGLGQNVLVEAPSVAVSLCLSLSDFETKTLTQPSSSVLF